MKLFSVFTQKWTNYLERIKQNNHIFKRDPHFKIGDWAYYDKKWVRVLDFEMDTINSDYLYTLSNGNKLHEKDLK